MVSYFIFFNVEQYIIWTCIQNILEHRHLKGMKHVYMVVLCAAN